LAAEGDRSASASKHGKQREVKQVNWRRKESKACSKASKVSTSSESKHGKQREVLTLLALLLSLLALLDSIPRKLGMQSAFARGTQFTCFTSAKSTRMLTQQARIKAVPV
jgi:hypothetical protein